MLASNSKRKRNVWVRAEHEPSTRALPADNHAATSDAPRPAAPLDYRKRGSFYLVRQQASTELATGGPALAGRPPAAPRPGAARPLTRPSKAPGRPSPIPSVEQPAKRLKVSHPPGKLVWVNPATAGQTKSAATQPKQPSSSQQSGPPPQPQRSTPTSTSPHLRPQCDAFQGPAVLRPTAVSSSSPAVTTGNCPPSAPLGHPGPRSSSALQPTASTLIPTAPIPSMQSAPTAALDPTTESPPTSSLSAQVNTTSTSHSTPMCAHPPQAWPIPPTRPSNGNIPDRPAVLTLQSRPLSVPTPSYPNHKPPCLQRPHHHAAVTKRSSAAFSPPPRHPRAGQLTTRIQKDAHSYTILYRSSRFALQRCGVRSAAGRAALTWVNHATPNTLPLRTKINAALADAAAAAAQHLQHRAQHAVTRRVPGAPRGAPLRSAARCAPGSLPGPAKRRALVASRMVRVGGTMYYLLQRGRSRQLLTAGASAAQLQQQQQLQLRQPMGNSDGAGPAVARRLAKPVAAAAAPAQVPGLMVVKAPSLRLTPMQRAAQATLQRSLKAARAKKSAAAAAHTRGLCLHYCRRGICKLALQGKCSQVHDPEKVAVCTRWLAGACTRVDCRLQHKVKPELMPACQYFLQGLCSAAACPYLHVNVAPSAPVCRSFLAGHCPHGSSCPHKHFTRKMAKEAESKVVGPVQTRAHWTSGTAKAGQTVAPALHATIRATQGSGPPPIPAPAAAGAALFATSVIKLPQTGYALEGIDFDLSFE